MSLRHRALRLLAVEGATVALALVTLVVVFSIMSPYFMTGGNIQKLLVQSIFVLITALGMTFVLIAGGIDLSVGSVLGLSAGTTLWTLQHGGGLFAGLLVGLATGVLAGLLNGFLIAVVGISDFIVTLATLGIAAGLLQVLTWSLTDSWWLRLTVAVLTVLFAPVILALLADRRS